MQIFIADGYIASEITVFEGEDKTYTAKFVLAITTGFGDTKRTDFVNTFTFGNVGKSVATYKKKGDYLMIRGTICNNVYQQADGTKRVYTNIVASQVWFGQKVDKKEEGDVSYAKGEYSSDDNSHLNINDFDGIL